MMPGGGGDDNRAGTETGSHTAHTWEASEPRKDQPTDARNPVSHYLGPVPCPAWACAFCEECSHTCLPAAPSFLLSTRPRASQRVVWRDSVPLLTPELLTSLYKCLEPSEPAPGRRRGSG